MKLFSFWRSLATYRVRIAMNLKGLKPDEIVEINLMKGQQREEAFRKVNPMMAIPALVDGDGPALFESLAIIEYLEHELKLDEDTRNKWCQNWHRAALTALETNLKDKATGKYAHGDQITVADICLASQAAGAGFFKVDLGPFPAFKRVVDNCMQNEAFARAHPLKQPGAPTSV